MRQRERRCLRICRRAIVSMCCVVASLIKKLPLKERLAWTYRIMLTLDLFHIALTAKPRYRDKPDRYMEAMTICAVEPRCVNTSVVRRNANTNARYGDNF